MITDQYKADDRFRNRRTMAWISFWFIFFVGGGIMLYAMMNDGAADRVEKISFLLGTVFGVMTTIVVSYFTSSTVTQVNDLRFKKDEITIEQEFSEPPVTPQEGK